MTQIRGFPVSEFEARLQNAQSLMAGANLDALLLTTEPEVRYFTGYLTRFWESPTRPWFLVVPQAGNPIAVIPSIGADLMRSTWIEDIRTWRSPDLRDDGISLLAETINEIAGVHAAIGIPSGHETHLRMPLADYHRLSTLIGKKSFVGDAGVMRKLRIVKSPHEIAKIRNACAIAGRAFVTVPEIAQPGAQLEQVFRQFQVACLSEGADWVSYLAGGAGPDGYEDVISPASETPLCSGDVLMLDTGLVWDGYFCDFDRNFSIGKPSRLAKEANKKLLEAVESGMRVAKPGATASEIFHAMNTVVTRGDGATDAGRLGHGLGMQLTEWPSLIADDHTILEEGMVLTLEPGIETREGRIMVHEENIVVTASSAEFISPRAGTDMVVCGST